MGARWESVTRKPITFPWGGIGPENITSASEPESYSKLNRILEVEGGLKARVQ